MPASVRARLTLTIAVLAALASAGAVGFGARSVEGNLIEGALRERAERYVDSENRFVPGQPTAAVFDATILMLEPWLVPELTGLSGFDTAFGEAEFLTTEIDLSEHIASRFANLDKAGILDEIVEALDSRSTGHIDVLTELGPVRYDTETGTAQAYGGFDLFDDAWSGGLADSEIVLPYGELTSIHDELLEDVPGAPGRSRVVADPVLGYLETTTADGVTFGVLAEVSERAASMEQLRPALWFAALLLTVLATIATWILTGRALQPVEALTRRVGDISAGTLNDRVPVPETHDEIHALATTMNGMLDRIEQGDRERRRFVADASHELRTPVAVLRSEAEIAQRLPDQTDVADLAEAVLAETDRLGSLVEDLLALARYDELRHTADPANPNGTAGALAPPFATGAVVDLDEVVFEDAARSRRVEFDVRQVSAGRVRGSRDELARVVAHVFDNAARHADRRVVVGLKTRADRQVVELTVDDDGIGIAPEHRTRVFDRFVRLDGARTRDAGGAGLGLAVVQATVERLGGDVTIGDSPLGGARVLVHLPVMDEVAADHERPSREPADSAGVSR